MRSNGVAVFQPMFCNYVDLLQVVKKISTEDMSAIHFGGWEEGHYACMDGAAQLGRIFEPLDFKK